MQGQVTLGEIFREHGPGYVSANKLRGQEKGIVNLLSACRTAALGRHHQKCDHCYHHEIMYNSCRNRHCPLCQQKDKEGWLQSRMDELLPIGYYHLVFTIPHELNTLCQQNKKVMYGILFRAASQTLTELAKDPKHLGGDAGLLAVLHTWGQNMINHPHLHCIMPVGAMSFDKSHWVHVGKKGDFFVHVNAISSKFRGKFLDFLKKAFDNGELSFEGCISGLATKRGFNAFKDKLYRKEWVVNIQAPFGSPEKVLGYLSKYVFRVAISNHRIVKVEDGKVHFWIKDYRRKGVSRMVSLEIHEFIKRFLLHLLPKGLFKIRYYGILANRSKKQNIALCREFLEEENDLKKEEALEDGKRVWEKKPDTVWQQILEMITNHVRPNCKACKKGRMRFAGPIKDSS